MMTKLKNLRGSTKKKIGILLGLCAAFAVMQVMIALDLIGSHMQGLLVQMCFNIILAVSLNLTVGVLGELSLGHAGFMGIGAYIGALFSVMTAESIEQWWIRFPIALVVGGIVAGLFGFLIGIPVLRLRGDYLAIVTLAFGEIIWNLCSAMYIAKDDNGFHFQIGGTGIADLQGNVQNIANGAQGIRGVPPLLPQQQDKTLFIVGVILVIITVWLILNFIHSRAGRTVKAIRDNRIAAESIGINITKYKLIALAISAFFAGVAGVMYSQFTRTMLPTQATYGYPMSINILVFVVLGGMGSTLGSIVGAVVLTLIPEWLRTWTFLREWFDVDPMMVRMLLYAIILIVVMLAKHNTKIQAVLAGVKTGIKNTVRKCLPKKKGGN